MGAGTGSHRSGSYPESLECSQRLRTAQAHLAGFRHPRLAQQAPARTLCPPHAQLEGPPLHLPRHQHAPCTTTALLTFQLLLGVTVRLAVLIRH